MEYDVGKIDMYKDAVACQNGCNITGIVHSMKNMVIAMKNSNAISIDQIEEMTTTIDRMIAVVTAARNAEGSFLRAGGDKNYRKNPAVLAIFFKVYDLMGAPSETEMYNGLKECEEIVKDGKL